MRTLLVLLLLAAPAFGNVDITVGTTQVGLKPQYGYSPATLTNAGRPIMDSLSGNGTVIKVKQPYEWAGSWHGHETVESTSLFIDGVSEPVTDAPHTATNSAVFTRNTVLADSYRLTHTMNITSGRVSESAHFVGITGGSVLEVFYGWLGTRSNRLTRYAAFDQYGNVLASGQTIANNDALPLVFMPNPGAGEFATVAVAQYDPIAGDGVMTSYALPPGLWTGSAIHDRGGDNKLYLGLGNYGPPDGQDFTILETLMFFTTPVQGWEAAALASIATTGDMNGDGDVDNFDIQPFELALTDWAAYKTQYPLIYFRGKQGDINHDGQFDNFDINYLERLLTGGAIAVPEPGTLALSVAAILAMLLLSFRRLR